MKKLLMGLSLIASTSAFAEWTQMGGNPEVGINSYADLSSIRSSGGTVKMWALQDYQTNQLLKGSGKYFKSIKALEEYDCAHQQSRNLALIFTASNIGNGDVIYSNNVASEWKAVSPDTLLASRLSSACNGFLQGNNFSNNASDVSNPKNTISIDEAKSKCTDLGFKSKTEAFGKCVLKLSN